MNNDIFIRTLGNQVTVYDRDGNVIQQIPEQPMMPPKVTYYNILELEDKIMGIDSDCKPDFFIDFESDTRFRALNDDLEFDDNVRYLDFKNAIELALVIIVFTGSLLLGYTII